MSYSLAQNSPTIEEYKNTSDYRDRDLSVSLVEKTDLQEAFTFLHEATHFLCRRYPNLEDMEKTMSGFWNVAPLNLTSQTLEECYCDFNSVIFILKQTYPSNRLQKEMYYETRRMLKYIKQAGESNLTVYANVSHKDKIAYIKYYLKLLT